MDSIEQIRVCYLLAIRGVVNKVSEIFSNKESS